MKASRLLFEEHPLVVNPQLAGTVGLNEAIVLQQVHYWVNLNTKNKRNLNAGYYWTYNTYLDWQAQFPFWSDRTIRRIINGLEEKGYLVSDNHNKVRVDRTKWYRIAYDKLDTAYPSGQNDQMASGQDDQSNEPKSPDHPDKLDSSVPETNTETNTKTNSIDDCKGLFKLYEENIGMLTPITADLLQDAQTKYPASMIADAITVAVRANARNFKYIQAVLERSLAQGYVSLEPLGKKLPVNKPVNKDDPDKFIKGRYGHMVQR